MQLHDFRAKLSAIRSFAAPTQCPHCGDVMVAPVSSEFVEGGEIRHHWECEVCGKFSSTSIPLAVTSTVSSHLAPGIDGFHANAWSSSTGTAEVGVATTSRGA